MAETIKYFKGLLGLFKCDNIYMASILATTVVWRTSEVN